jgi:hypothetical protein
VLRQRRGPVGPAGLAAAAGAPGLSGLGAQVARGLSLLGGAELGYQGAAEAAHTPARTPWGEPRVSGDQAALGGTTDPRAHRLRGARAVARGLRVAGHGTRRAPGRHAGRSLVAWARLWAFCPPSGEGQLRSGSARWAAQTLAALTLQHELFQRSGSRAMSGRCRTRAPSCVPCAVTRERTAARARIAVGGGARAYPPGARGGYPLPHFRGFVAHPPARTVARARYLPLSIIRRLREPRMAPAEVMRLAKLPPVRLERARMAPPGAGHPLLRDLDGLTRGRGLLGLAPAAWAAEVARAALGGGHPRSGFALFRDEVGAQRRLRATKGLVLPADLPMHVICGSKDVIHS